MPTAGLIRAGRPSNLVRAWKSQGGSCCCQATSSRASALPAAFLPWRRQASHATSTVSHPLAFPTKANPTPLDIFHLSRNDDLSPKAVKARYYELCRLYHPDLRKGKQRADTQGNEANDHGGDAELKQINLAYEILGNPSKRDVYLRSGYGWGSKAGRAGQSAAHSPWGPQGPVYDFSRGRPMRDGGSHQWRGPYPSSSWDWADPHNPHFRPNSQGGATAGWQGQGNVSSNGVVFLMLCSFTLLVTPLTVWSATPSNADPADESQGFVPMVADRRHREAARALEQARREARQGGQQKREAISRRVKEIERARAFERAKEIQMIEMQQRPTGHLQLPAPETKVD
ncbi:hypothetical protein OIO90_001604 [Microbotryomycetes sp. JL221]|nr:hypothetical protein OIO90_001604 [Microbotryomycetes sp. JL221]